VLDVTARRTPWLAAIALAFALVLLAPWHAAGAAPRGSADFASPAGPEHRSDCPLVAPCAQAAPAQARKAAQAQPGTRADSAPHDRAAFIADFAARPGVTPRAAPAPSLPLYLVNLRLLR